MAGRRSRSVFLSYCHADFDDRDAFLKYLEPMCDRMGDALDDWSLWVDARELLAGVRWEPAILAALDAADVYIVLLSQDYRKSDFCMKQELVRILARCDRGEATVIGIALHKVNLLDFAVTLDDGRSLCIEDVQCLPQGVARNGAQPREGLVPLTQWLEKRDAWHEVQVQLEKALLALRPLAATPARVTRRVPAVAQQRTHELKLPYFCDRRQQVRTLRNSLRVLPAADAQHRPLLLLHEAHDHDSPDAWVTRLAVGELESAMPAVTGRKVLSFGEPRIFSWPDLATSAAEALQDLCDALSHKLVSRLADWPDIHAAQHKRRQPTLWWTEVPEHVEVGQVEHAAEALGAMLAQWPDRSRGAMLVVVVHVAATASDSAKQTVVERLGVAARATERFHLVNLGPLSPVSREDLRPWADDTHVRDHLASLPLDLDDLRDKLGSGLPMRAFVQLFDTLCGQSDR
jgi:TIR domain